MITTRIFIALAALTTPLASFAQEKEPHWLVDTLYGSGKINVVIAVVTVILLGIAFWLFRMDRRIARMEKETRK